MYLDLFNNERRIAIPKFHQIYLFNLTPTLAVLAPLLTANKFRLNFD